MTPQQFSRHTIAVFLILLVTTCMITVPAAAGPNPLESATPAAGTWSIEKIASWDPINGCDRHFADYPFSVTRSDLSLAIDKNDVPHVVYPVTLTGSKKTTVSLMYATRINGQWVSLPVMTHTGVFDDQYFIVNPSIAIDNKGVPLISYGDSLMWGTLKFARPNGNTWDISDVDRGTTAYIGNSLLGNAGHTSSLVFDAMGTPHISYNDGIRFANLMYASWDGSEWETTVVDRGTIGPVLGDTGYSSSLAIDRNGHPHIAYLDGKHFGSLKYATNDGTGWKTATVDRGSDGEGSSTESFLGDAGYFPSLALKPDGTPVIIYEDAGDQTIMLAVLNRSSTDISFDRSIIEKESRDEDSPDNCIGRYPSLGIDARGNMHVAYYDRVNRNLKAWHFFSPATMARETIDSGNAIGKYGSQALDAAGNPHVVYYDEANHAIKYASLQR